MIHYQYKKPISASNTDTHQRHPPKTPTKDTHQRHPLNSDVDIDIYKFCCSLCKLWNEYYTHAHTHAQTHAPVTSYLPGSSIPSCWSGIDISIMSPTSRLNFSLESASRFKISSSSGVIMGCYKCKHIPTRPQVNKISTGTYC